MKSRAEIRFEGKNLYEWEIMNKNMEESHHERNSSGKIASYVQEYVYMEGIFVNRGVCRKAKDTSATVLTREGAHGDGKG